MAAWQASPVRGNAAPLPVVAFAPLPANASSPPVRAPEGAATRAHPFAELLRQSRDDGAPPLPPVEHTLPVSPDVDAGANTEASAPASAPGASAKTRPRPATASVPRTASHEHPGDAAVEGANDEDKRAGAADGHGGRGEASGEIRADASTVPPQLADGTAAGTAARGDKPRNDGVRPAVADADALAATASSPSIRTDARSGARGDANDARLAARTQPIGADPDPRADTPTLVDAIAEATRAADAGMHRPSAEARIDSLAPALATNASNRPSEVRAATAPAEIALPTPIVSPDFGAAFGVQVSVLVKDGVQQAELHLNPAETGPVSIQIALDGTQARIDFGADLAATRAAIEKSLPELAAALRDAGLTLTGGGVSQHAGGRASSGDDGSSSAPAGRPGDAKVGQAPPVRIARRVVADGIDLYA